MYNTLKYSIYVGSSVQRNNYSKLNIQFLGYELSVVMIKLYSRYSVYGCSRIPLVYYRLHGRYEQFNFTRRRANSYDTPSGSLMHVASFKNPHCNNDYRA